MRIAIATPHRRHDALERKLSHAGFQVARIERKIDLNVEKLTAIDPRFVFFPHWSWKIPAEVFEHFECVIFHMTDLPYGRGGSPLQNLIARGHKETMLSALRCEEGVDAGPIYLKRPLSLLGSAEEILLRASDLIETMIKEIAATKQEAIPQSGEPVYFRRRQAKEGNLSLLSDLNQVFDYIRMLDAEGYPAAFIETEHFRFEFTRASMKAEGILADVRIIEKVKS